MEEKLFKYSISERIFNKKLGDGQFWQVNQSIIPTETTIRDFATLITRPKAHSWSGGIFKESISNNEWIQSSIIGLDFDKGEISLKEVYQKFEEFGICPNLHYDTFGTSVELHKFRVVFFFDSTINDIGIYDKIMIALEKIFFIDPKCKNPSRIFYGGTNVKITSTVPVSLIKFIEFIDINKISRDNYLTRNILGTNSITANFCNNLYNNYKDKHFLAHNNNFNCTSLKGGKIVDWDMARKKVKILDSFFNGEWLDHNQLFGLVTNIIYIRGGEKKIKEIMKKFNLEGKTNYTSNNFAIIPYVKKMKYHPIPVYKFSNYIEDSDIHDIITEVNNIRGHIEILEPINKISLKEAEEKMISSFNKVLDNDETNKTYIFSLPTAIGKTRLLTNVEKCVIALPTNNLKNEVKERMVIDHTFSPDTIKFFKNSLNTKIEYYYQIGLPKKSMGLIGQVSEFRYPSNLDDIKLAADYITQLEECKNPNKTVLTTHKRVLNSDSFIHKTIIFDEDPLNSLVEIKSMSIKDIIGTQYLHDPLKEVAIFFLPLEAGIYETPNFKINHDNLSDFIHDKNIFQTNVFDFFNSKFFIKNEDMVYYIIKKELPIDSKNIIMSATIPVEFYKKLYPEMEFEVFDIKHVEQKGEIIQYTGRSCSRKGLNIYGKQISDEVGGKTVITFIDHKEIFQNSPKEVHFGNCSGYDNLNGQNITIVGTPHRNNIEYFLMAKLMGVNFDIKNSPMTYQKIQYNGFEFMFNAFDNEDLRDIQLSLIESDLIQAVGRARTLRNDCTVEVYSNFPLYVSDQFIIKKKIA
ncbi:hypothetical protein [Chryseobacterium sp. AG363]|uniref:hypothetical protein n=1 Tax=Chryseobacterium sp. AG363 TaxID=2183997 RepID=UPI000E7645AC|nr:hypothetical protein [Chryseobacterium sp. AG363]RKE77855.1 hypothetical protein DEU39_3488 [Chryseobacterium sp. AG363]